MPLAAIPAISRRLSASIFSVERLDAHRPAQLIGLDGGEVRRGDRHLHHLLLEQRHAQGAFERPGQQRVRGFGLLLLRLVAAQVGVHGAALDRAGRISATSMTRS
jgi:hypothetical protein